MYFFRTILKKTKKFYDAKDEKILVDGLDVKEYKLEKLHEKIGYVSQKAFLFAGSIKENVAYVKTSREITDEKGLTVNKKEMKNRNELYNSY